MIDCGFGRYHGGMDDSTLRQLADAWLKGDIPRDELLAAFRAAATDSWGSVALDLDRESRCGFPEVVYGAGKPADVLLEIAERFDRREAPLLVTRIDPAAAEQLSQRFSGGRHNAVARTWSHRAQSADDTAGSVAVVSAGTTDRPVAEEAVETLKWMGIEVDFFQDVGVAGPHRLLAVVPRIRRADAVVVVAGMEGALPSVVGGHVAVPVIAVPTSVGYGAAFSGLAALLGMLNSCAANVTVVNIDGGFKGGYVAGMIAVGRTRTPASDPPGGESRSERRGGP